jgi:membrane-bound serine protease (ClpP class)
MPVSVRLAARAATSLALVLAVVTPAVAQDEGILVRVTSPVTTEAVTRIKNRIEAARNSPTRPIKKVVFDFTPGGKDAHTADFGATYTLASYIRGLHDLTTIGYLSANLSGHGILPALACKELAASREASIGEIVKPGEPFSDAMKAAYHEITSGRESVRAVVAKMADRSVSLGKGQKNGATWFVDLRDKAGYEKAKVVVSDPNPFPFALPGMEGKFNAEQMQTLLSATAAASLSELGRKYNIAAAGLKDDPLNGRPPQAYRYVLRGPIDNGVREATRRVIKGVQRDGGNILIVVIDCVGGDPSAARDIAADLEAAQEGENAMLVVGFIPEAAPDTGAIIALGCGELVMSTGKADKNPREATLGDFEAMLSGDPGTAEFLRKNLKELAEHRGIPPVLIDGMLDRNLTIIRAHRKNARNDRQLLTEAEFEAAKADWESEGVIKNKGDVLRLTATRAAELGVARFTIDTREPADVYTLYGLEAGKVKEATPGWLDAFGAFLRIPAVTVLLVVIGFAGLVLEIKVPGTTVPGIVAALCFILMFWAHTSVNGNAAILGVMLFVLGLVLILLEVFVVPGFGVPGVLGILFMVGGIGLATIDRVPQSTGDWLDLGVKIGQYLVALIVAVIVAFATARYLPNIPGANRMLLESPDDSPSEPVLPGAAQAAALLGAVGAAVTTLRPAGMAQFGEQYVDVVTDGGYIPAGAKVQVIEVEATRIVVKEV